ADEASALAELQGDIERHALAWTWGPDSFVAALKASAQTARRHFSVKAAANGVNLASGVEPGSGGAQ
ncbi:MAG TPA: hypothetical protein VIK01_15785, partial [Polyangiaceae bacterium]